MVAEFLVGNEKECRVEFLSFLNDGNDINSSSSGMPRFENDLQIEGISKRQVFVSVWTKTF